MTMSAQRKGTSVQRSKDEAFLVRNDSDTSERPAPRNNASAKMNCAQQVLADCIDLLEKTQVILNSLSVIRQSSSVTNLTLNVRQLTERLLDQGTNVDDFDELSDQLVQIACRIDYEKQRVIERHMMLDGTMQSTGGQW